MSLDLVVVDECPAPNGGRSGREAYRHLYGVKQSKIKSPSYM